LYKKVEDINYLRARINTLELAIRWGSNANKKGEEQCVKKQKEIF
jgi:hypothetical protein